MLLFFLDNLLDHRFIRSLDNLYNLIEKEKRVFLKSHGKIDGIFIAGCCEGPKDIPDTVAQAKGAASEVLSLLSRGKVEVEPITAFIDDELCSGCGLCQKTCNYGALSLSEPEGVMAVNEILCKGCGACVAICPSGAISQNYFTYRQLLEQVEALTL